MAELSLIAPGGGEVIALGPVRVRILEDGRTTEHRLGMAEITVPPHTDGPAQHRHVRHDEGFYVVSGTARFLVGDATHDAPAGSRYATVPGTDHENREEPS